MGKNYMNMKYICFGIDSLDRSKFVNVADVPYPKNIKFAHVNKPYGGLWVSPYIEDEDLEDEENPARSSWEEWCAGEYFHLDRLSKGVTFKLKESAYIYIIEDQQDAYDLWKRFPLELDANHKDIFMGKRKFDFKKIAKEYDAVLLTEEGMWNTRGCLLSSDPLVSTYGWDCESMVILNFDAIDLSTVETYENPNNYNEED